MLPGKLGEARSEVGKYDATVLVLGMERECPSMNNVT
jgi:hypothetical protein